VQNTPFSINKTLNIRGRLVSLEVPRIMGILNVTPDSFFDGGRHQSEKAVLEHVEKMTQEGATFIDVGGYSSRPGASDISVIEETGRVIPVISAIVRTFPEVIISIDTFRASVASAAVDAGASLVNDISGGSLDDTMFESVGKMGVPYILMHMRGNPQTMTQHTSYENLVKEIIDFFHQKLFLLQQHGVKDILIDPGFGFAKNREQNFELLNKLSLLTVLGKPVMAGLSRKSMIWKTLDITPEEALNGTTVLNTMALLRGASVLRVHDVKAASEVVRLFLASKGDLKG
jgi:dihydropteroate synthase